MPSLTDLSRALTIHDIEHPAAPDADADMLAAARATRSRDIETMRRNIEAMRTDGTDSSVLFRAVRDLTRAEYAARQAVSS